MTRLVVQERGSYDTANQLRGMGLRATQQESTMRAAGRDTAARVKGVPVDTGRLEASVQVLDATDDGFVVGSRVPYAKFVFGGTKNMAARPPEVPPGTGDRTAYAVGRGIVHR